MGENPVASGPIKLMIGDQIVKTTIGKLTISEEQEDSLKDDSLFRNVNKTYEIECKSLIPEDPPIVWPSMDDMTLEITREPGKMPRKMKKALKTDPRRKTKWGRKAQNYINRNTYRAPHARMEIGPLGARESEVTATINFDALHRCCEY